MPTETGHTRAIRSSRVIGTILCNASGEQIGAVEDVVLDKASNRIMFAVVSIGGVVTTSDSYHPMPWPLLDYSEENNGYVVSCPKEKIAEGPAYSKISELTEKDGTAPREAAYKHYGIDKDW